MAGTVGRARIVGKEVRATFFGPSAGIVRAGNFAGPGQKKSTVVLVVFLRWRECFGGPTHARRPRWQIKLSGSWTYVSGYAPFVRPVRVAWRGVQRGNILLSLYSVLQRETCVFSCSAVLGHSSLTSCSLNFLPSSMMNIATSPRPNHH